MMQVYLSQNAYDQLHHIIEYLEVNWPVKVRDNFLDKLDRSMMIIGQMPYSFPASQALPGLRKCVITSQTTAYYRVDENKNEVEIISVIDNRQELI